MNKRILVVDDEPTIRDVVAAFLERDGYSVDVASTGDEAAKLLEPMRYDLLVLDLMLPGVSGLEILRRVRDSSRVPVIVLTARTDVADRVVGLELGADDYLVKPFSPRELVARVRSVLRRAAETEDQVKTLDFGELAIDLESREVTVTGQPVHLTAKEFDLLSYLARVPRRALSRDQLLEGVWDSSAEWQDPSTVTVHVRRLRTKLGSDPERWITTVRGIGYRFDP